MSNAPEEADEVFENPHAGGGQSIYLILAGVGLIVISIGGLILAIVTRQGEMVLHLSSTVPAIVAVGLLARGFTLRGQPSRICVGPDAIEVTINESTRRYPWSEIGSATSANILNSPKLCLQITDTAGKTVIRVDESFPDYQRLVSRVESFVDAKPDDTSLRLARKKARRMGLICLVTGSFLVAASVAIALESRRKQRENELLPAKGIKGEAEIVRRFVAPNGVTKRIEFRIAGSSVKNVEVEPSYWDQLERSQTVPVIYVPDEPNINRLEFGEVQDQDFAKTPLGGYLLSGAGGALALLMLCFSPLAWMGYDFGVDQKTRIWKLRRLGRVIWASREESADQDA